MTKPRLILIGAGGHARSCIDVIEQQQLFEIAGLIGLPEEQHTQHLGYEVIGVDCDLPAMARIHKYALVAIGQINTAEQRVHFYQKATLLGLKLPVIISPTAHVSLHATLGVGTIVMHRALVNASVIVGHNCIINNFALLEHGVSVGDHCHISTGAILNGNVEVGEGSFIGSGSVIKEGVKIGKNCLVGMGLALRHDLDDNSRYTG
jgi:sugar O-acyltransferase (sialic acid O-acetyltransferase NeuD family)